MNPLSDALLETFEESIKPVNEARLLPPHLYTSDAFYEFEKDACFGHDWLCVGRLDEVPEPGDYITISLVDEPLVVVRDKDHEIRVLSAVCRHRGMVLAEGRGHVNSFLCPYHHWVYGTDGRLLGCPEMERCVGFEKSETSLPNLRVETWNGFIFANFDPQAPPLAPTLRKATQVLEHFQLDRAVTLAGGSLPDLPWNWKVMMENFNDPYHASRLHGPLQTFAPSHMNDFLEWDDGDNDVVRIQHFTQQDGSFNPTMRCLLPVFPGLTNEERRRGSFMLLPPTLAIAVVPDEVAYFIICPQGAGKIDIHIGYCFDPSALEEPLFDKLFEQAKAGVNNFNVQDVHADEMVQKGLQSRFAPRGRYSWQEETLRQLNRWLVTRYRRYWPRGPFTSRTETDHTSVAEVVLSAQIGEV
jgi:phenylpropionate dioxygenase-like ring-hydroxylating dioxygenase large terminal subunit